MTTAGNGKRLVFITQAFDPQHPVLGVSVAWANALAARCAGVDVITLSAAPAPVQDVRVTTLGKEHGAGRAAQTVAFYRALASFLPGAGAIFVHMVPRYALLAMPLVAAFRRPIGLWYAQGGVDRPLRLAAQLVDAIFTPTRGSFPLPDDATRGRVMVTGHGIDTARYVPDGSAPELPKRLLAVGRLSPSKRYDLLLDAAAALPDRRWSLRIAGGPLYPSDREHAAQLRARVARLGLERVVEFAGPRPHASMPAEYRAAWALAHTSATGSLDKVVLEAMACGTPVISTAPPSRVAMGPLAEQLWCERDAPAAIAAKLEESLAWSNRQRAEIGAAARGQVVRHHGLSRWAEQVVRILGVARTGGAPAAGGAGAPAGEAGAPATGAGN